jgi:Mycothiol maleylpyruvate isomerase N-terminal domain
VGWSVKDVALHLLAGDLSKLARGRDRFDAPTDTVPSPTPTDFASLVTFLDELNTRRVRELRWLSIPLLVDLLTATGSLLHAYLAGLDPFQPGEPVSWAGQARAPNWLDVAREFTERWVHQQQIRDPVEPRHERATPAAPGTSDHAAATRSRLFIYEGQLGGSPYSPSAYRTRWSRSPTTLLTSSALQGSSSSPTRTNLSASFRVTQSPRSSVDSKPSVMAKIPIGANACRCLSGFGSGSVDSIDT